MTAVNSPHTQAMKPPEAVSKADTATSAGVVVTGRGPIDRQEADRGRSTPGGRATDTACDSDNVARCRSYPFPCDVGLHGDVRGHITQRPSTTRRVLPISFGNEGTKYPLFSKERERLSRPLSGTAFPFFGKVKKM
jgi:hypothetical protein